jgi:hypothetical protein
VDQAYGGDTSVEGMALIDVENNNKPISVAALHLSNDAGAGCEAEFYDALNKAGDRLASGAQHDVLMNLQEINRRSRFIVPRCGNSARFFRWNDTVYFESKPAQWPPVDAWNEYHRVARIRHGAVEEVCDFKFTSQVALEP